MDTKQKHQTLKTLAVG